MQQTIFTLGHSTRSIEQFLALLAGHGVTLLGDVRTVPKSRHNPQFGSEALAESMHTAGIEYRHLPGLGGFRRPRVDSPNAGWRNLSFRGYADYMQTPEFTLQIDHVLVLSKSHVVALMCSEAVPWRCHRSLIADALVVRGIDAREIVSPARSTAHRLTRFAHVEGETITYPG